MSKDQYKGIWLSPSVAVERFNQLVEKYGVENAVSDDRFKPEREAWVMAMFLFGLRKITRQEFWLELETVDSTPDAYGYYLEEVDGKNYRRIMSVEITEFEEHSEDIFSVIKNKINRAYPTHYILLVYARKAGVIKPSEVFEKIQKTTIPFAEIWILSAVDSEDKFQITKIFPDFDQTNFSLKSSLENNKSQGPFAKSDGRSSQPGKRNLGTIFFPLP